LIIGDLHFGYEESLNRKGVAIPRIQLDSTIKDLNFIIKKIKKLDKVILLGDVRHSFNKISSQEIEGLRKIFELFKIKFPKIEIIIIKGNHDNLLRILLNKEKLDNIKLVDYFLEDKILFFHGDIKSFKKIEIVKKKAEILVIGHFHPSIKLSDGIKVEKYKCFIEGRLDNKKIVIVPSFFPLIEGTNIFENEELESYKIKDKRLFVISPDQKVLNFGRIN
jgi:putative SbcD/Mre11-related phosphoesterase